jgi:hypothetical protein
MTEQPQKRPEPLDEAFSIWWKLQQAEQRKQDPTKDGKDPDDPVPIPPEETRA